ncbi:MAG TPA: site-2 protease family protein [Terracidiphilus sp.]
MSTLTPSVIRECPQCGRELALGAAACPECHALVYSAELNAISRDAKELEAKGELAQAREMWNRSLTLLPADSKQWEWVRDRVRALGVAQAGGEQAGAQSRQGWVRRLGPLAPLAIVLAKGKTLLLAIFKFKFLFSFLWFIVLYAGLFGWRYGLGIAVSVLVHELGHYIDIKRRGLPAEMPVFLPGLGAYVRWDALGVSRRDRAQISLAGPLAGWVAAGCCYLMYAHTQQPVWAALARTGAVLNIFNLIPVWFLDGAKAVDAMGLLERVALLAAVLGLWAYTRENICLFVAAGVGWRLFTKDKPGESDGSTWFYFVAVLFALGLTLYFVPQVARWR